MRRSLPFGMHLALLLGFAVFMTFLWMLPVLLAGFPYVLPGFVAEAQAFDATGVLPTGNGRLSTLIVWWLSDFISWQNIVGWSAVSAASLVLALFPWWWSVCKLFDARVAWLSTLILGFLPMYWIEALRLSGYSFALLFLFLGFALFLELRLRNRALAAAAFGLCFGAALGSRDAFITLIPWFVLSYLWYGRSRLPRALAESALFLLLTYAAYTAPLIVNARSAEGPLSERITMLLPSLERTTPSPGHIYPDDWTYEFDREAYDPWLLGQLRDAPFLVRQQASKNLRHFGLLQTGILSYLKDSVWPFANALPPLLQETTVGGAFLWLFILPGIVLLYRRRRQLLFLMGGLWLSMEVLLRFVLHFSRDHLMDVGWMLALLAALGILFVAEAMRGERKRLPAGALTASIALLVSLQLVQANRKQLAYLYSRSNVPESYAAQEALASLPLGAVVAHPRRYHFFAFSDVTNVNINTGTVDRLASEGRLREPFAQYGVTHIIGYDEERATAIEAAVPGVEIVSLPRRPAGVPVTPWMNYLLHLVR